MTRPAIVYLHGFRSSPASAKAARLRAAVEALPPAVRPALEIPALVPEPAAAVAQAAALVERHRAAGVTIVGSSLGGYYATHLAERYGTRAVLVNPSVRPYDDLAPYIGMQTNLYTGATFEVTRAHFDELAALRVARITDPARYFLMVEAGDEVLDYRQAVTFYAGAWQSVSGGGDHAFQGFAAHLPALLRFAGVADRPSL